MGNSVVTDSVAIISSPAMVQERAWRRATIVRSILARLPSSINGVEANLGSSVLGSNFPVAGSKRRCNGRERVAGVGRVYLIWFLL